MRTQYIDFRGWDPKPAFGEPGEGHGYCVQERDQQAAFLVSSFPIQVCTESRDKVPRGHIYIFGQVSLLGVAQLLTPRTTLRAALRFSFRFLPWPLLLSLVTHTALEFHAGPF